jgi:hypothetical protein
MEEIMDKKSIEAAIRALCQANPKLCWRTLRDTLDEMYPASKDYYIAEKVLDEERCECSYRCDGGDGPHPVNGSPGCFYSGKNEP